MTQTREQWLETAVQHLRPLLADVGAELGEVRVSVGWPSTRGTSLKNRTIGQCWQTKSTGDKVPQIFISPMLGGVALADDVKVLHVLTHELIHAWDDCEAGHKGAFARTAKAVGLIGKMTATTAGPELTEKLEHVIRQIGSYPHSPLNPELGGPKKQSTRMLKVECSSCGCILRMTAKWMDEAGLPTCGCGSVMEEA